MTQPIPFHAADPIDAVITWVDGADPLHRRKRERLMRRSDRPLHANGVNPHRWACNDELNYCLRSIANHAAWLRHVWIVTDAQVPDLSSLGRDIRAKIRLVDHRTLFAGHEAVLPTFNSLAIETMIWRIPGLAERFVYFNDDVFLTAPLSPGDVFRGNAPVLRGKWTDYRHVTDVGEPALFNHFTQINAAAMLGFDAGHLFASAHVVHPLRRSVLAQLSRDHPAAFLANIGHRFRDVAQFLPQGLHNHACILSGNCVVETAPDHLHLRTGAVIDYPLAEVRAYLQMALRPEVKFLCINDLPQVESAIPDMREWIERAIGAQSQAA